MELNKIIPNYNLSQLYYTQIHPQVLFLIEAIRKITKNSRIWIIKLKETIYSKKLFLFCLHHKII